MPTRRRVLLLPSLLALAGCIEGVTAGNGPDLIVVAEFAVPEGVVTLDPSFGFSLYRGQPGVPQQQRARSVGHAVGFLVSDTATERLRALGYEAASTTDPNPHYAGRALVVSGAIRAIDEGRRRQVGAEGSSVVVDVQVRAAGPGGSGNPLLTLHIDSRQLPGLPPARRRETGVNADAAKVGDAIARAVANLAQHNNWARASR